MPIPLADHWTRRVRAFSSRVAWRLNRTHESRLKLGTRHLCSPTTCVGHVSSWPPEDGRSWSLGTTARVVAAEVAAHEVAGADDPAVQRAVAASKRATTSVASGAADAGVRHTQRDEADPGRDVAAALLALQGIDWRGRVDKAMTQIDKQADEFAAQLQHLRENGVLPIEVQRVAVEQLLDAIGAIAVAVQGLLMQAEQEMVKRGFLVTMKDTLRPELQRLPAAVATVRRWGLEVPSELLSINADELRSMPLAATDPSAGAAVIATVQRVIGALVVAGGDATLKHAAWVDFDNDGKPVLPMVQEGWDMGRKTISRPPTATPGSMSANLDAALKVYDKQAVAATGGLVHAVLGDVTAYASAKATALAEPGAEAAIAELSELTKRVPQPCGPRGGVGLTRSDGSDSQMLQSSGMARAKALARMADPRAPPPTALEHAVHKQLRAAMGSKRLYSIICAIALLVGIELVVLPGGVKKLPRTVFKCAVNYDCDLSEITDQVRCTVVCESLAQVAAMLRALLASDDVSVVRVKNRFAPEYDATPAGGYLDLQTIVSFECGEGEWMLGEVQVNLWSMLRIKEAPSGGHKVFNFARSLRAYDEATYAYRGKFDSSVAARIAEGALLVVNLSDGRCKAEGEQVELARALASSKCRVAKLNLGGNEIGNSGAVALADALMANTSVAILYLWDNKIGASGAVALADALKTNASVTTIYLGNNKFGAAGAVALADALKTNTALSDVNLEKNGVGDSGAAALADALKTNTSVKTLVLRSNTIRDTGAVALADALKTNGSLSTINLGYNDFGDSGALALADVFTTNTTIASINLASNNIGDSGAVALADALKTNTTVTAIDLDFNKIGADGKRALAEVTPVGRVKTSL
jgi:hypothetical protein